MFIKEIIKFLPGGSLTGADKALEYSLTSMVEYFIEDSLLMMSIMAGDLLHALKGSLKRGRRMVGEFGTIISGVLHIRAHSNKINSTESDISIFLLNR